MSVKLLILKSYEDVIADVKEMMSGDRVVGYLLSNPFVTKLNDGSQETPASVTFYPYAPLSKQKEIPIPCDWVVSIVEPLDEVKQSYLEQVNGENSSTDEQSNSDNSN
jgi:hypothetical protein